MEGRWAVDPTPRRYGFGPLTDWTVNWPDRAAELQNQLQAVACRVNQWIADQDRPSAIVEAELTADPIEQGSERAAIQRAPKAARQFAQIATGTVLSIAVTARH